MDKVLLATYREDLTTFKQIAERYDFGLELQAFSDPATLSNNWPKTLKWHRGVLDDFKGPVGVHGAFYDLTSASLDPAILEITQMRYLQNLHVASELGASYVLFHLNYLGAYKIPNYRAGWHQRQIDFWSAFADKASEAGVPVLIENSWEDDPKLITNILAEINSPYLKACLDIAHATLYSKIDISKWIQAFDPYLICSHLNNHNGQFDMHWPLDRGIVDYESTLHELRELENPPLLCLEMSKWSLMKRSLTYFDLSPSAVTEENIDH
jgi:sugar phosphate isomerase/epimerase